MTYKLKYNRSSLMLTNNSIIHSYCTSAFYCTNTTSDRGPKPSTAILKLYNYKFRVCKVSPQQKAGECGRDGCSRNLSVLRIARSECPGTTADPDGIPLVVRGDHRPQPCRSNMMGYNNQNHGYNKLFTQVRAQPSIIKLDAVFFMLLWFRGKGFFMLFQIETIKYTYIHFN